MVLSTLRGLERDGLVKRSAFPVVPAFTGKMKRGRLQHFTVCGILMHSSLAVTPQGLPLGLTAIKFWTRSKFKGTNALKRKINPTRVPIEEKESFRWLENLKQSTALLGEPQRCVHIGEYSLNPSQIHKWRKQHRQRMQPSKRSALLPVQVAEVVASGAPEAKQECSVSMEVRGVRVTVSGCVDAGVICRLLECLAG